MKNITDYLKEHKEFEKRRDATFKKNEDLIKDWNSIPDWQFWRKPSFEEQRQIIIDNWKNN